MFGGVIIKIEAIQKENLNYNDDFRSNIVNMIMELEKTYYKISKLNMKSLQLFNKKLHVKKELRQIKSKLNELNQVLYEFDNNKNIKKDNIINQVIRLDFDYKIKTYELFCLLKLENDSRKKIKIIHQLKHIYSELLKEIDKKDYKTKNKVRNILNYLNKILKKENLKLNEPNTKKENNIIKEIKDKSENKSLENCSECNIYYEILNGKNTSEYTLIDIMETFRDIIRHYKINENIIKCAKDIIYRFDNELKNNKVYLEYFYSIIDSVKNRKQSFDKKNKKERMILKKVLNIFKEYKNEINYELDENKKEHSYMFNLVRSLLLSEDNYPIIKKLIDDYPNIVNSYSNGQHIIEYILELYFENYEKLLNGNSKNYIKIEYIKEVYYLFTRNVNLCVDSNIKDRINKQTFSFIRKLTNDKNQKQIILDDKIVNTIFVKNDKKKKIIINETMKLSAHYYNEYDEKYELKKLNEIQLENQINYIVTSDSNYRNRPNEINLLDEENIILKNGFVTYNYKSLSSSNILRVSVCDISNLIPEDTSIDSYIYNKMLEKSKLDQRILDRFKFKEGKESSAITFKLTLDKNNRITDLYVYKSKIKPQNYNNSSEMYQMMIKTINSIIKRNNYEIDSLSENEKIEYVCKKIINKLFLELAEQKKIPIIFSGVEKIMEINSDVYSDICSKCSKLPQEEARKIHSIISNNLGEFHYSDKKFDVIGDFDLNLVGIPNYIFLENQRIIKSLLLNDLNLKPDQYDKLRKKINIKHDNLLIDLNTSINHKDVSEFDIRNKKKKKNILTPYSY